MKILLVHNHYGHFAQGGEANVMNAEANLLLSRGHDVTKYERTNSEIYADGNWVNKIRTFFEVAWSIKRYQEVKKVIEDFRPDVMHVHNYWLVLTPSIFAAAKECGIATVLTLHNYRLICPGNQLLRDGKICETCLKDHPYRVLIYRCFPGKSLLKSYLSLVLYRETKKRRFLEDYVDAYIALSSFGRSKFIEGGLPEKKIFTKPNFTSDPLHGAKPKTVDEIGAFYAGRISPEKGIHTLIRAWKDLNYPLVIAGDGPDMDRIRALAPSSVEFRGWLHHEDALDRLRSASFFIFPSEVYEGFPLSLLEAMALGKAIIASDLGPRREMIEHGISGLLFRAGDAADLRAKIKLLIKNDTLRKSLGDIARKTYLERYTPEKNYQMLINIYEHALQNSRIH